MTAISGERLVYTVGLVAVTAAAIGTFVVGGDLEVTLLMVTAVVAGLLCFDISMERRLASFAPWVWLSIAPAMKTVPTVWYELTPEGNALYERYDHAGSLLFGICVLVSVAMLSRPARSLGRHTMIFDLVLIVGTAVTAAIAGASVAFREDQDFGSASAARFLETSTWLVAAALLTSVVLAAAHTPRSSRALTGVLVTAAGAAALLSVTVAGRNPDRGWWAFLFAGLAWSSVGLGSGALGVRRHRTRASSAGAVIAVLVAVIAAAAAIAARSDRLAWGPGWILLGALAVGMSALAMASKPTVDAEADLTRLDAEQAAEAKERALKVLRSAAVTRPASPDVAAANQDALSSFSDLIGDEADSPVDVETVERSLGVTEEVAERPAPEPPVDLPTPVPAGTWAEPVRAASDTTPVSQPTNAVGQSAAVPGTVAVARAAAALASEPSQPQRHSRTPLAHAHHFDPSTGMLSATGLQHFIARAFEGPRRAGEVTIMLFTIRDLDEIEKQHGRLASAAITREIAERVRTEMPDGTGARFGRAAYAVLFVGDLGDPTATVQRLARTLLALRAPVEGGSLGAKTDVVAGMAQCYETEDAAQFITRANLGLARAVRTEEPTFVAMP